MATATSNIPVQQVRSIYDKKLAVTRLNLTNFRSYSTLRIDLDSRPLVLVGPNGAGKTNLLEAVSCLSHARGLRRAKLGDMVNYKTSLSEDVPRWAVAACVDGLLGPVSLGVGWTGLSDLPESREKKDYRIDGSVVSNQAALAEHVAVVWMTPAQDRLFIESPGGRRRFIDTLVQAFDPSHRGRVKAFDRARSDRLRVLRSSSSDTEWLDSIERGMAECAIAISAARLDIISRIGHEVLDSSGPFPKPVLHVSGLIEDWLNNIPALEAEGRFRERLASDRLRDTDSGGSVGPHRSDLCAAFSNDGPEASQASTGEQKAILLAILLAHARLLSRLRGAAPIMLLDEVVAHLDVSRREALFDNILSMQVQAWMTGTDMLLFESLAKSAQFMCVDNSTLNEESPSD